MYGRLLVVVLVFTAKTGGGVERFSEAPGDVNLALLLDTCRNTSDPVPFRLQSLVSTATWVTQRVNFLDILSPLKLGLSVFETCTDKDYYKTIFELYERKDYLLGIVHENRLSEKVLKFLDVLEIGARQTRKFDGFLLKSAIQFLVAAGWVENVTVLAPDEAVMRQFYLYSKAEMICIQECIIYEHNCPLTFNTTNPLVFIGNLHHIEMFLKNQNFHGTIEEIQVLFVPLDGSVPKNLPEKSYVIIPPHDPPTRTYHHPENILPSPVLFETAQPILTFTNNIATFLAENCNETHYKLNCLRSQFKKKYQPLMMTASGMLEMLKIAPLRQNFVYNIYRVENDTVTAILTKNNLFQSLTWIFSYNIFDGNLSLVDHNFDVVTHNSTTSSSKCLRLFTFSNEQIAFPTAGLNFRSEAWVYAFLALSLLGVLFCILILIFLLVCICRRDILEGNPVLTLALLVAVMVLFCAVLPFSLQHNNPSTSLCMAKTLGITLGYAFVFSLLLSRCILLATAAKKIGFMTHIAGPVQAFLCLFIFGVQAALSLHVIGKCLEVFQCHSFIYLMSYNTMLLLLLLCLCPLVYKCQRNYCEGKYFSIAVGLMTCAWAVWLPLFGVLGEEWKEPMLCLGLVSTGGILLGAVFIPRTYLMTIAAARDKITSTLPSMTTANSCLDIYRTSTQPIYDCVNVAAINAVAVARAGVVAPSMQTMQHPDLYSCPAIPDDEEFDFRCESPPSTDKITRF